MDILIGKELYKMLESLTKVGGDKNWNIYYVDRDGNKWVLSYPNSHQHGGGAPELRKVGIFRMIIDRGTLHI